MTTTRGGHHDSTEPSGPTPRPGGGEDHPGMGEAVGRVTDAVVLFVVALVLLLVLGACVSSLGLSRRAGVLGPLLSVALPELFGLLLPALLFIWHTDHHHQQHHHQQHQRARFRMLVWPPSRRVSALLLHLLAGGLLGLCLFYVLSAWLEPLYEHLLRLSPAEQRALERMIVPASGLRPLGLDLLTFALVPALCEEVLFRGAILLTLLPDQGDPRTRPLDGRSLAMVLLSAVLFGLIHLSWGRMIPTTLLGMAFALTIRCGGSLWVPVAMHAVNNALVVLMVRRGLSSFTALGVSVRLGLVPVAAGLLVLACVLLGRGSAVWKSVRSA